MRVNLLFLLANDVVAHHFPEYLETGLVIHIGQIFWVTVNPQRPGCNPNANGNWAGEENPLVANGGEQAHLPRFYVKKRATRSGMLQYIATRIPLVLNFDDEAGILGEPSDPNHPQGPIPDRFSDRFRGEIASIFCKEDLGEVGNSRIEQPFILNWNNCEVVELLVGLCLRDERITPRRLLSLEWHSNHRLLAEALDVNRQGHININQDSLLQARANVMPPRCPRFARIPLLIDRAYQAGSLTINTMREWSKHLQAAREQGYVMALFLTPCGNEYRWHIYEVQYLENLAAPAAKGALRNIMTQSILPDDFTYWYFCCATEGPDCN